MENYPSFVAIKAGFMPIISSFGEFQSLFFTFVLSSGPFRALCKKKKQQKKKDRRKKEKAFNNNSFT